ncbi:MAG: homocysteine S-methyltransferase family protein, partial [Pontimonas sp.]|nr:homocysteine S-methyltransferase family protein [Pontimonas sp.]
TLAQWWPEWQAARVSFVGGCCGHGATAIAQLRDVLEA